MCWRLARALRPGLLRPPTLAGLLGWSLLVVGLLVRVEQAWSGRGAFDRQAALAACPRRARERPGDGARRKVAADVALGRAAGVDGTPCVFLDGRRVRDLRPTVLTLLVAARIREAERGP